MDKMLVAMIGKVPSLRRQIRDEMGRDIGGNDLDGDNSLLVTFHDDAVWMVVSKEMEKES